MDVTTQHSVKVGRILCSGWGVGGGGGRRDVLGKLVAVVMQGRLVWLCWDVSFGCVGTSRWDVWTVCVWISRLAETGPLSI